MNKLASAYHYLISNFKLYIYSLIISLVSIQIVPLLASESAMQNKSQEQHTKKSNSNTVIVVTGSRQQSDLITFTGNIDHISTDDIDLVASIHPSDVLNRATGVYIQTTSGLESLPSLRSPVLTGPGAAGAYLFLENGIATRAAGFANNNGLSELNLAQADRIEIIRGPASAVYGSNAVHGVINVVTLSPSDEEQFTILTGPNNRLQIQGTTGHRSNSQGDTIANTGNNANIQVIRDSGYRDESGFTSLKLGVRTDYSFGDYELKTQISGFMLDQQTAGFISSSSNGDSCFSSSYSNEDLYKDRNAMKKNCNTNAYRTWSSLRVTSTLQRDLKTNESITITPYFRTNDIEFRQHFLPSEAIEKNGHYSVGLASNYFKQINIIYS